MSPYILLHGYFDESGKFTDKDVIAFCGWITPYKEWDSLVGEWNCLLQKHKIPYIHMTALMNYRAPYSGLQTEWGNDKRDTVLMEFAALIRKYAGFGVGAALDAKHFKTLPQRFRQKVGENLHYMVFRAAMRILIDKIEEDQKTYGFPNVAASIICDQDEGTSHECLKFISKFKKLDDRARGYLAGICFCDSKQVVPLQTADMVAFSVRKEVERRRTGQGNPSALYKSLMAKPDKYGVEHKFFHGPILDAGILDKLANGEAPQTLEQLM